MLARLAATPVLALAAVVLAAPEKGDSTPETDARALLSEDVRTSWTAARALVERPGSENTAVREALTALVAESGLPVEMPKRLRRAERAALVDRIRQAALLARLGARDIPVPEGMVAVPGGLAVEALTGKEVVVDDFLVDRLEITREDFARFLKDSDHEAAGEDFLKGWREGRFPAGTGRLPVTHVSRADASAFAVWRGARLPSAEEWTLGRGGCGRTAYPWGPHPKTGLANVLDGKGSGRLEGVEGRPTGATPLGVLRLAGNVAEWTSSDRGRAREHGVVAGESFLSIPEFTRTVLRKTPVTTRRRDLGFRCAASLVTR